MKKLIGFGGILCIGLTILLANSAHAQEETLVFKATKEEIPKVIISRRGKVEAEPDKAIVNIKIVTEETKIDKAADKNNEKMNVVIEILKETSVEKKDIKTLEYNIVPLYEGKPLFSRVHRPTSYVVTNAITVNFYKLDMIGKILSKISEIESVNVYNLEFTSTKIEEMKREALRKAAQSAREAALDLVDAAGGKLGKVLRIEESVADFVLHKQRFEEMSLYQAKEVDIPEVEAGTLEIEASCTITYEIEQKQ